MEIFLKVYLLFAFLTFLYIIYKGRNNRNSEHWVGVLIISIFTWWIILTKELIFYDSELRSDIRKLLTF